MGNSVTQDQAPNPSMPTVVVDGRLVRSLAAQRGLSRKALAGATGVTERTVSRWLGRATNPVRMTNVCQLAKALGVEAKAFCPSSEPDLDLLPLIQAIDRKSLTALARVNDQWRLLAGVLAELLQTGQSPHARTSLLFDLCDALIKLNEPAKLKSAIESASQIANSIQSPALIKRAAYYGALFELLFGDPRRAAPWTETLANRGRAEDEDTFKELFLAARINSELCRHQQATQLYRQSVAAARRAGAPSHYLCRLYTGFAEAEIFAAHYSSAVKAARIAGKFAEASGSSLSRIFVQHCLIQALARRGRAKDLAEAKLHLKQVARQALPEDVGSAQLALAAMDLQVSRFCVALAQKKLAQAERHLKAALSHAKKGDSSRAVRALYRELANLSMSRAKHRAAAIYARAGSATSNT